MDDAITRFSATSPIMLTSRFGKWEDEEMDERCFLNTMNRIR